MKVIAVVVNWNGREDTLACLASLQESHPVKPHVILVDNGSTDGTTDAVAIAYPDTEIIRLARNLHFARGANAGLELGLKHGADLLWLLNNDTRVEPGTLAEMVRVVCSDAAIGVAGARLVHPFNPPGINVGANCDFSKGAIHEPRAPVDASAETMVVDYVWGCSMLIKAELLRQQGLLDGSLKAYFEDADFCLRARWGGWLTVTALRAVVHHYGSKSANQAFLNQVWLRGRNWWRIFLRYAPPRRRVTLSLWLLGYRLPLLAWASVRTIVARKARPRGRPIRLWRP